MIVVGVDAGGSQTVAAAVQDGRLLEPAVGAAANPHAGGIDRAASAIAAAIDAATQGRAPDAVVVGAAGAGVSTVADALLAALAVRYPRARIAVKDDAQLALRSAVPAGDGIVLVAGTGSIAYAEIGDRAYRAGGFGSLLGDEGSGFAIGAAAFRVALRALEGRAPRDEIVDTIVERTGAKTAREVVAFAYGSGTPVVTIAAFAPVVLDAASQGQRAASKIVQAAALDLFELVRAVYRMANPPASAELPLVLSGGLLQSNSLLTYLVETRIANELPGLAPLKNGPPAYAGAAAQAQALLDGA